MGTLGIDGATLIKKYEGFSLKFYGDPYGYPTVGWGHLITDKTVYSNHKNTTGNPSDSLLTQAEADALSKSLSLGYTSPITQPQADNFFTSDTSDAVAKVNGLTLPSQQQFSKYQFDALVSLVFNCGDKVLQTPDVVNMLCYAPIFTTYTGNPTAAELDTCSRLVSKAFSYDPNLKPRRNEEATLFCKGMGYSHKYPVYTL